MSTFLGYFRWAFMPLGLCALVAVGVHAASDTIDDHILWLVDHADALFDGLLASWSVTEPLVNVVRTEQRTLIARAVTLILELSCDVVLAVPALGYREEDAPARFRTPSFVTRARTWRALVKKLLEKPTAIRIARPLMTAAVVLAGTCAVARMVQGALFLSLRAGVAGDEVAGALSRLLAIGALALLLGTLGWRAVLRSLQHADKLSDQLAVTRLRAMSLGLLGTAIAAPVALAAVLEASPVFSFFR
ncbi:MAG: hypothetical protein HYZ28_26510 [Myxococcales bacterium]|nr:hypothetical protein [Myxococcales bacterium]